MYNLTHNQERLVEQLVDEHNWLLSNNVEDADDRFDAIYIKVDEIATDIKVDREEFWNFYFN